LAGRFSRVCRRATRFPTPKLTGAAVVVLCAAATALGATTPPKSLLPQSLSAAGADAVIPDVAVDSKGDTVVVWAQAVNQDWTVQSAYRPAGGSWTKPLPLSAAAGHVQSPEVAVAGSTVVATWLRYNGKNLILQVAQRDPKTGSWSIPVSLSPSGRDAQTPKVAVDTRGDAVVVWADVGLNPSWTIQSAYRPAGGSWENTTLLDSPEQGTAQPDVAVDAAGNATAVWAASGNGRVWTVRASYRTAAGVWSKRAVLSGPDPTGPVAPQLALEGNGGATAVWSRSIGNTIGLELVTRSAATGKWSPVTKLFSGAPAAVSPEIATDAKGDGVIVWTSQPSAFTVDASVRRPGKPWSKPTQLATGGGAVSPQVAIDAHGGALAVWARNIGSVSRVQAAALPVTGTKWSAAKAISTTGGDSITPQAALDADGDGATAWGRVAGETSVIQAAGYDATGPSLNNLVLPAAGTVGKRLAFSVAPTDVWSPVASVRWTFGDGSFTSSKVTSHVYTQARRYTVHLTATDSAGHVRTVSRVVTITAS
jgi:hypothetical protein